LPVLVYSPMSTLRRNGQTSNANVAFAVAVAVAGAVICLVIGIVIGFASAAAMVASGKFVFRLTSS
jgi:hypothetical protein